MTLETRLCAVGTASLFEVAGKRGAMDPGLRLLPGASDFAGRAVTVRVPPGDNLALHRLLAEERKGDVIVVDAGGKTDVAVWGEVMSAAAIGRGYRALVVDGAVRDVARLAGSGFSVAARGSAIPGPTKAHDGETAVPVRCGGIEVMPGDWIVADADGVLAIPAELVERVAADAEKREANEQRMIDRLRAGQSTTLNELGLAAAP